MRAYLALFVTAALVSALLTPVVRPLALRVGAVSLPGGRNVNERAVPRLGGIAVALGFLAPLVGILFMPSVIGATLRADWLKLSALLVGGVALMGVGVLDDTRRIRAVYKLCAQVAAATLAFACGYRIDAIELPLLGQLSMGIFALPVTVLWITGVTNAINLIDGLDGLAAGAAFFAGVTNFVVAYVAGSSFFAAIMEAMLGAVVGFLFFNFNPARIFMGDSGSYFLGFILGTVSLGAAQKASTTVSLLAPIVALGLPIVDMLLSMVRRVVERRSIFSPDRGHIHHRLLDMGLTHRRAVLILYGVCIVLTTAALGVSLGRSWQVGIAILCATLAVVAIVRFAGYFESVTLALRRSPHVWNVQAQRLRSALPETVSRLAIARNDRDVIEALDALCKGAGLARVEIVAHDATVSRPPPGDLLVRQYGAGSPAAAQSAVRFAWSGTAEESSPQSDVMLQIIVDLVTAAFVRYGSRHAPRAPVTVPTPVPGSVASVRLHELR
ncbi:MAG: undecaprenyl/decaprenyl-phosphate alpha-N-acetylglucosaminyl 1-phosphate transferase [Myxococcota bacterium]|nr:undecaprenyl/decaprenyl-phosphate alpha-N-acetylglucosaminyl 1-phosphate transferase [Myxococcota bacterium]